MVIKIEDSEHLKKLARYVDVSFEKAKAKSDYYKEHATKKRKQYLAIRVPLIVLSISLPYLVAMQSAYPAVILFTVSSPIIALLVAILAALDTFFRFGETWAEERAAQFAITSLIRRTRDKITFIESKSVEQAAMEIKKIHDEFRNEYEQIVGETLGSAVERIKASATTQTAESTQPQ